MIILNQDEPFRYQWYYVDESGEYSDGFTSEDERFTGHNVNELSEFGMVNRQREKIVQFFPSSQEVSLNGVGFNYEAGSDTVEFTTKRHVKFAMGLSGEAKNVDEQPRVHYVGHKDFLVSLDTETGDFGFRTNN